MLSFISFIAFYANLNFTMAFSTQSVPDKVLESVDEIFIGTIELIEGISSEIRKEIEQIKSRINTAIDTDIYNRKNYGDGMDSYKLRDNAVFEHFSENFDNLYQLIFTTETKTMDQQETWFKVCWHILAFSQMRHLQTWTSESVLEPKSVSMRTVLFNLEIIGNLMEHSCDYESMPKDYVMRCLTGLQ